MYRINGTCSVIPSGPSFLRVHDLALATRNRRDFEQAGVEVVDPFA